MTGDEVYGRDATLRQSLEEQVSGYGLKIPCSFGITLLTGQKVRADPSAGAVPGPQR